MTTMKELEDRIAVLERLMKIHKHWSYGNAPTSDMLDVSPSEVNKP